MIAEKSAFEGDIEIPMHKCTKIFLLRHGETANASTGCYNGQNDISLSSFGMEQIKKVALRLKNESIRGIYSSDLSRALVGAKIIAENFSLSPVIYKELRELNYGRWEGLNFNEIQERFPEESRARYEDFINYRIQGGGENILDLKNRIIPIWEEIKVRHRGECCAVMVHGGVTRIILAEVLGLDLNNLYRIKQDYAALNIINFYPDSGASDFGEVALLNG